MFRAMAKTYFHLSLPRFLNLPAMPKIPKRPILVPTDFSEVGETALNHAIKLAQTAETRVILLHVVKDKEMIAEGRTKLKEAKGAAK